MSAILQYHGIRIGHRIGQPGWPGRDINKVTYPTDISALLTIAGIGRGISWIIRRVACLKLGNRWRSNQNEIVLVISINGGYRLMTAKRVDPLIVNGPDPIYSGQIVFRSKFCANR